MNKTKIEWVKNPDGSQGFTWNPITGCLNHVNGLCRGGGFPCYAYRLANGRLRKRYLANSNLPAHDEADHEAHHSDPFWPRFWPKRLEELKRYNKGKGFHTRNWYDIEPKGIFVCDMSDLFGLGIPQEWQEAVFEVIRNRIEHRFYLLTKQPQNLLKWSPFPDNCWVGVTATNEDMFQRATGYLHVIEASVKYVSIEPLLSWNMGPNCMAGYLEERGINWLILGSQTKPYKPPQWEWVSQIINTCVDAGIPYFLKDNLERIVPKVFPSDKLVQEMP